MARPLLIEYPDAYYHVINRRNNRGKIFENKAREVAIYIARDMTGITCKDLGEFFGGVSGALTEKHRGHPFKGLSREKTPP